jgi:tagatose 1,6-diphosphate aldolase
MGMATVTSGKLVNLMRLADRLGRFKMLAVDQRDSLRAALARATGRDPKDVTYEDLAATKESITQVLAPHSTATLVDPVYGMPRAVKIVPGDVGILIAAEETGYEKSGPSGKERKSRLIDAWSVAKSKRSGATAVKLLIYYNPDASGEVVAHQQRLVRSVGDECLGEDIPFLLEIVAHPIAEPSADTPEFARKRAPYGIEAAREFSEDKYSVDILKLEFPGDLKYSRQFHQGVFDRKERPAIYDLDEIRAFCRELDAAARRPWVILSGGVDIKEFLLNLELAVDAGASGFLCGRAIWKNVIALYPDLAAMQKLLSSEGVYNFSRANAVAERARPWFDHGRFGGGGNVRLRDGHDRWYREYGEA